jgi:hypothetical protein
MTLQGRVSDSDASKALQQEGVLHSDLIPGKYEGAQETLQLTNHASETFFYFLRNLSYSTHLYRWI